MRRQFAVLLLLLAGLQPRQAAAEPSSEAYLGQPFGVGRVTIDVFRGEPTIPLSDERFTVLEDSGRALYPVLKQEPVRQLVRNLLNIETPRKVTIYYLFQGDTPFDLSVFSPVEQAVRVKPLRDDAAHARLLDEWWSAYSGRWNCLRNNPEFPPVAENFLTATLARRLGKPLPTGSGRLFNFAFNADPVLGEMVASEPYVLKVDREMLAGDAPPGDTVPVPDSPQWAPLTIDPAALANIAVEPLASHVPEECFYVRFGSFANYQWFRDLKTKWDGDLANMLRRRGIQRNALQRAQQQMSLTESVFARFLGPQVIEDAAVIGLDPYTGQGPAAGILFHAKNSDVLEPDLTRQRREALTKFPGAREGTLKIADKDVSLIATDDGRVRSYYVRIGDFHLVSTSETLVRRVLEASAGQGALADLPSFRLARQRLPLERNDSMFVFVSEKFFQNLCSPQYYIESLRRIRSAREPLLREMAALVSKSEGLPNGILPEHFATRSDGSQLDVQAESVVDSVRGAPGFFRPVPDVAVTHASPAEVAAYRDFLTRFQREVGQMPPIAVGVQRQPHEGSETLAIDVVAQPITGLKIETLAKYLGSPSADHLQPITGDVVSLEVVLNQLASEPTHVFGALRDFRSPLTIQNGAVEMEGKPAEFVRGYIGAWPKEGLLGFFGVTKPPTGNEPEPIAEDLWQAQREEFLLITFKPDVAAEVLPQLAMGPAARPAQLWLRIDDLTGKELAATVNALGYMRTRETSVAATRMMNSLANQFHIERAQGRELAERLVDGTFVCPLGGQYELFAPEKDLEVWISTALPPENRFVLTQVPEDFKLPLLNWFRGLRADFAQTDEELSLHLDLNMTPSTLP